MSWLCVSAHSIWFNTQICTLCLIKSEGKFDLAKKLRGVHFSQQKRVWSTFLIPKTLQASLTTKTSQLAAVNGFVSLREAQSLFLAQENATESLLEQAGSDADSRGEVLCLYPEVRFSPTNCFGENKKETRDNKAYVWSVSAQVSLVVVANTLSSICVCWSLVRSGQAHCCYIAILRLEKHFAPSTNKSGLKPVLRRIPTFLNLIIQSKTAFIRTWLSCISRLCSAGQIVKIKSLEHLHGNPPDLAHTCHMWHKCLKLRWCHQPSVLYAGSLIWSFSVYWCCSVWPSSVSLVHTFYMCRCL